MLTQRPRLSFKYYDCSRGLAPVVVSLLPRAYLTYVEVFPGFHHVLLAKELVEGVQNVLNVDSRFANFVSTYNECLADLADRCLMIPLHPKNKSAHTRVLFHEFTGTNPMDDAVAYYMGVRLSSGNEVNVDLEYFSDAVRRTGLTGVHIGRAAELIMFFNEISSAQIVSQHPRDVIAQWDNEGTVFYAQVPFPSEQSAYTSEAIRLILEDLSKCKGHVIVSGFPDMEAPSEWVECKSRTIAFQSQGNPFRKEVVWVRR